MNFKAITSSDELWRKVRNYAENCSWRAGKALANRMDNNGFSDWKALLSQRMAKRFAVIVWLPYSGSKNCSMGFRRTIYMREL